MKYVLYVGPTHPEADKICELCPKGVKFLQITNLHDWEITYRSCDDIFTLSIDNLSVTPRDIIGVFWRRPPVSIGFWKGLFSPFHFSIMQARYELLLKFCHDVPLAFWFNNYKATILQRDKITAIRLLKEVSLPVPDLVVKSDLNDQIPASLQNTSKVAIKTYGTNFFDVSRSVVGAFLPLLKKLFRFRGFVFYTKILPTSVAFATSKNMTLPCIFQAAIVNKLCDLRFLAFFDEEKNISEVLGCKINSRSQVDDVRSGNLSFEPFPVSSEIKEKLILLLQNAGMKYAAVDAILTQDGKVVFVADINWHGRWLAYDVEDTFSQTIQRWLTSSIK